MADDEEYARSDMFDGLAAYVDAMAGDVDEDECIHMGDAILGHPARVIPRDLTPDDSCPTHTSREQHRVENVVGPMVREVMDFPSSRKRCVAAGAAGGKFTLCDELTGWSCTAMSTLRSS